MIAEAVEGRFIVLSEGNEVTILKELAPDTLKDFDVLRLQRTITGTKGWRTFIIAYVDSVKEIDTALKWSAYCKEELLDPESADLYLLLIVDDPEMTIEECVNIEANEKFCRKFILRPGEQVNDLLKRTFLLPIEDQSVAGQLLDPLSLALTNVAKDTSWLDVDEQRRWRTLLLSSGSGQDLIEQLFQHSQQESTDHEISGEDNN